MISAPSDPGIRSSLPRRRRFRFSLPFLRRGAGVGAAAVSRAPKRVRCARENCPNTVLDEWEESGLLCSECALEEELRDREARWDRIYPGR
jgi:hypothetical protein